MEYHCPCPFCRGIDRFRVQPDKNFWACRQCKRSGDLVAYLVETNRITKAEAFKARHGEAAALSLRGRSTPAPTPPPPPEAATPPGAIWQARAWQVVADAQAALWSKAGARALDWLRGRGLHDDTIQAASLGYIPADVYGDRAAWGLPEETGDNGKPKRVWLPRGVVIPWFVGRDLWRVNIRRPAGDPKYIGPTGWGNALYNADALTSDKPAVLVEGELDALTIEQEAGDLIIPCATGSVGGARRARWEAKLLLCPVVLAAFDADDAGEDARRWWLKAIPNGRYWRPYFGDVNAMHQKGFDLRAWILAGLREGAAPRNA